SYAVLAGTASSAGTATDSTKVLKAGDTMTGTLTNTAATGLDVSGSAYFATSTGSIGVGTTSPANKLYIYSTGGQDAGVTIQNVGIAENDTPAIKLLNTEGFSTLFTTNANHPTVPSATGFYVQAANGFSILNSAGTRAFNVLQTGNVGIGTTAPSRTLEVAGIVKATSFEGSGAALTGITATDNSKVLKAGDQMTGTLTNTTAATAINATGTGYFGHLYTTSPSLLNISTLTSYNQSLIGAYQGGGGWFGNGVAFTNSSVGTNVMGLNVNGDTIFLGDATLGTNYAVINAAGAYSSDVGGYLSVKNLNVYGGIALGSYAGTVSPPANSIIVSGNVGIGTTAPSRTLEVAGIVKATSFEGSGAGLTDITGTDNTKVRKAGDTMTGPLSIEAGTNDLALRIRTDSNTREALYVSKAGNVGIGTTSPGEKLDVNGNINVESGFSIKLPATGFDTTILSNSGGSLLIDDGQTAKFRLLPFGNDIYFQNSYSAGSIYFTGSSGADLSGDILFKSLGNIRFGQAAGAASGPNVIFNNSGDVGIGTTGPTAKLAVANGNISIEGTGYYYGDGSKLTGVASDYVPLAGMASSAAYAVLAGTASTAATADSLNAANYYTVAGLNVTNTVTAGAFVGDGSGLTGVATPGALTAYVLKAGDTMTGTLTLDAAGANLTVNQGSVGIGTAEVSAKLQLVGGGLSGDYVLKIYAGNDLVAWARKK
ncbi:MAG: hypothetical protein JW873_00800, partial [Candidatus Saganbacteria bacterium]|nr:hypothetical protein [Candidatus Saganbacteria bacterium]